MIPPAYSVPRSGSRASADTLRQAVPVFRHDVAVDSMFGVPAAGTSRVSVGSDSAASAPSGSSASSADAITMVVLRITSFLLAPGGETYDARRAGSNPVVVRRHPLGDPVGGQAQLLEHGDPARTGLRGELDDPGELRAGEAEVSGPDRQAVPAQAVHG